MGLMFLISNLCYAGNEKKSALSVSSDVVRSVDDLVFMTEELPPFQFINDNNENTGIFVDIVVALLDGVGSKIKRRDIEFHPWARAFLMLEKNATTALFTTARTKERDLRFKWVGPLSSYSNKIVIKKNSGIIINLDSDLLKYKLGAVNRTFDELSLLKRGVPYDAITRVNYPKHLISMLQLNRLDGFVYNEQIGKYLIEQAGLDIDDFNFIFEVERTYLYIALNRDVPDQIVKILQDGLSRMQKRTEYQSYFDTYWK